MRTWRRSRAVALACTCKLVTDRANPVTHRGSACTTRRWTSCCVPACRCTPTKFDDPGAPFSLLRLTFHMHWARITPRAKVSVPAPRVLSGIGCKRIMGKRLRPRLHRFDDSISHLQSTVHFNTAEPHFTRRDEHPLHYLILIFLVLINGESALDLLCLQRRTREHQSECFAGSQLTFHGKSRNFMHICIRDFVSIDRHWAMCQLCEPSNGLAQGHRRDAHSDPLILTIVKTWFLCKRGIGTDRQCQQRNG